MPIMSSSQPIDFFLQSLKETIVIARPHMVEDFYSKLMSDHVMDGDSIIFSKVGIISYSC